MKKAMLMLFAMAFVVCTAVAGFDGMAYPSEKKAFDARWDGSKCCEGDYEHHSPCAEICPGSYPFDRCGCDHRNAVDICDKHPGMPHINCFVFESCEECGKVRCDGRCNECKKRCDVYEYCPICGAKYQVEAADGYCDRCGRDCYCIEKCEECDHNHYYNGYCDECADRCYYGRCCHTSYEGNCEECMNNERYVDAEPTIFTIYLGDESSDDAVPVVEDGYPEVEIINPEMQDRYTDQALTDQALLNDSPADEAQAM